MSMQSIGNIGAKALYDWTHDKDSPDYLRNHPGNARDVLSSAYTRLKHHPKMAPLTIEEFKTAMVPVEKAYREAQKLCESPIERDMLAALMTGNWHSLPNPFVPVLDPNNVGSVPDMPVFIIPQFSVLRYRLDFAITVKGACGPWIFAVECDGADFHDAKKDMDRDVNLHRLGIRTHRVTGKDIHARVTEVADHIISLACVLVQG